MKKQTCQGALGSLFVVAAIAVTAPSASAQYQSQNFDGPGGAYSDFDTSMQAVTYTPRVSAINSGAASGAYGQAPARPTVGNNYGASQHTRSLRPTRFAGNGRPQLMPAGFHRLDKQFAFRQLPQTNLDSFVANAGNPEMVYGDEGDGSGPPPMAYFTHENSIQSGIETGPNSGDLTTGHMGGVPYMY